MTDTLQVLPELAGLRARVREARASGQRIGLVPTMGNLHAGHLALVAAARERCELLITSIFVNPLQFGPNEDLERYPRTFEADCQRLAAAGCDAVFAPSVEEMYPRGLEPHTLVSVPQLASLHCGASRPGHFDGVCTVVSKLFNMVQPDLAVFGLKDYQQFRIIETMVQDLQFPLQLLGVPTVREASGLAMSSRNQYLDATQRQQATALFQTLQALAAAIREGAEDYRQLEQHGCEQLDNAGLQPDYCHICRREDLQPARAGDSELAILAAARLGSTRLIDNLLL